MLQTDSPQALMTLCLCHSIYIYIYIYTCNERLFKTNFLPQKRSVVHYTRDVFETLKLNVCVYIYIYIYKD